MDEVRRSIRSGITRRTFAIIAALGMLAATACSNTSAMPNANATDAPFPNGPPARAHRTVSTKSAAAQAEFDHGLTLLYAFNPEEALIHFQNAGSTDPRLAMAFWGIAMTSGPNVNVAYDLSRAPIGRDATAQARAREATATPVERALIDALAPRYAIADANDVAAAQSKFASSMASVAQRFPHDADVQTLYAESLMDLTPLHMWNGDGSPGPYTLRAIAAIRAALAIDPNNLGANHYAIHLYEDAPNPSLALPSARRLAALAFEPAAEHLAHMPAHLFMRVGDYDDAASAARYSLALFSQLATTKTSDAHNGYEHHDLQVLDYAYEMSGRWSRARDTATRIASDVDDNGAAIETYLRFHKWQDALALTAPAAPGIRWQFARAYAAAENGDTAQARGLAQAFANTPDSDPRSILARAQLDAAVAFAEKRDDDGIADLRAAVAAEDRLPVKEPPAWYYPVRESLGAHLLQSGHAADAASVFRDDLRRNHDNPRSLFGLANALSGSDPAASAAFRTKYESQWKDADAPLSLDDLL